MSDLSRDVNFRKHSRYCTADETSRGRVRQTVINIIITGTRREYSYVFVQIRFVYRIAWYMASDHRPAEVTGDWNILLFYHCSRPCFYKLLLLTEENPVRNHTDVYDL